MSDVDLLQDQTSKLLTGAYSGNIRTLQGALDKGANINAQEEATGLSALHIAIGKNYIEAVRFLLERGAIVAPDKRGRWPSTIAELCEVDGELCDLIVDEEAKLGTV